MVLGVAAFGLALIVSMLVYGEGAGFAVMLYLPSGAFLFDGLAGFVLGRREPKGVWIWASAVAGGHVAALVGAWGWEFEKEWLLWNAAMVWVFAWLGTQVGVLARPLDRRHH